jgi:hypothetical protein
MRSWDCDCECLGFKSTLKNMNDQPISDEQRKAFAELIKQQQKRYGDRYGEYLKSLRQEWGPRSLLKKPSGVAF